MDMAAFLALTPAEREQIITAFDPPETSAAPYVAGAFVTCRPLGSDTLGARPEDP
jgi:hypothetical protein